MSNHAVIPKVVLEDKLSHSAILLYGFISMELGVDGVYDRLDHLEKESGYSKYMFAKALKELIERNHIEIIGNSVKAKTF